MTLETKPVTRGDLDRIARTDVGLPDVPYIWWTDDSIRVCAARYLYGPGVAGRDCPACPAPRAEHDGWGAPRTGCQLSIALITRRTT